MPNIVCAPAGTRAGVGAGAGGGARKSGAEKPSIVWFIGAGAGAGCGGADSTFDAGASGDVKPIIVCAAVG